MELREFIQTGLDRAKQATAKSLEGLNQSELSWHPKPDCNSIGFILFHMARSEDRLIHAWIQSKPQIWESEKWYKKVNRPVEDSGSGYTAEQVASFVAPELKGLLGYADAVRARTLECLKDMTGSNFDRVINTPRGNFTVGGIFALVLVHVAQHTGEIAYLRGFQRGMNN